jgi:hypothetical protein
MSMRPTALTLMAVLALAACSKADDPKVSQAKADLNAAAAETGDAANSLASAAASDVKTAGAKVKQAGGDTDKDAKNSAD